jgi:hypothetical protein
MGILKQVVTMVGTVVVVAYTRLLTDAGVRRRQNFGPFRQHSITKEIR